MTLKTKELLAKMLRTLEFPVTLKSWTGKSVPSGAYATMISLTVPAGTRAVILGTSGNGIATARNNICQFSITSGTANESMLASGGNDSGSGNFVISWGYVDAQTDCVVEVRQYGYGGAFTNANGKVVAIALHGDAVR